MSASLAADPSLHTLLGNRFDSVRINDTMNVPGYFSKYWIVDLS